MYKASLVVGSLLIGSMAMAQTGQQQQSTPKQAPAIQPVEQKPAALAPTQEQKQHKRWFTMGKSTTPPAVPQQQQQGQQTPAEQNQSQKHKWFTMGKSATPPAVPQQQQGQDQQNPTNADLSRVVYGLGTYSRGIEELFDKGCEAALFEAQVCMISGHMSNGSQCYAYYGDGHSEWVNAGNYHEVAAFLYALESRVMTESSCGGL